MYTLVWVTTCIRFKELSFPKHMSKASKLRFKIFLIISRTKKCHNILKHLELGDTDDLACIYKSLAKSDRLISYLFLAGIFN